MHIVVYNILTNRVRALKSTSEQLIIGNRFNQEVVQGQIEICSQRLVHVQNFLYCQHIL